MYAWECMYVWYVHARVQTVTKHQSVNSSTLRQNLPTCNWTGHKKKGDHSASTPIWKVHTSYYTTVTWGRDQCLHALFNDRCTVHGQHSPRKEASFSMTGIQYMVSTCPEDSFSMTSVHYMVSTHLEKRVVSVWQVYIIQHSPRKEAGFSVTGVHYIINIHPQKRRGWFQYDRCTLHGEYIPREEQKRAWSPCVLVSAWQVYITVSAHPEKRRRGWFQHDRCILHGQHSPKEEDSFNTTGVHYMVSTRPKKKMVSAWQVQVIRSVHTKRRGGKDGFRMGDVHYTVSIHPVKRPVSVWQALSYTVSAHREKRRGWSQYDRCTLPSSALTQQKGQGPQTAMSACPAGSAWWHPELEDCWLSLVPQDCWAVPQQTITIINRTQNIKMQWLKIDVCWHPSTN